MVCMILSQQRRKGADPMRNKQTWYPRSGASTRTNNEVYINNQQPALEPTYFNRRQCPTNNQQIPPKEPNIVSKLRNRHHAAFNAACRCMHQPSESNPNAASWLNYSTSNTMMSTWYMLYSIALPTTTERTRANTEQNRRPILRVPHQQPNTTEITHKYRNQQRMTIWCLNDI